VEVMAYGGQAALVRGDFESRLRQVVVHVRVDAQEEMLHDQEVGVACDVPCRLPTTGYWYQAVVGSDVAAGERVDEPLHACAVFEPVVGNSFRDVVRDSEVERGEVSGRVVGTQSNGNKLGSRLRDHSPTLGGSHTRSSDGRTSARSSACT